MKKFAFDYDDTISSDIYSFGKIFNILQSAGHEVIVVTGRSPIEKWQLEVFEVVEKLTVLYDLAPIEIVFAGTEWKRKAAKQKGHEIDIWVDNAPEYIGKQWLLNNFEIGPDNLFSPETSGRIRAELEKCIKDAWIEKMKELKIYPKRVTDPVIKEKLWERIDNEAQEFIQKLMNELSEIE